MQGSEQTRIGRFFDHHPVPLRLFAACALLWGVGYLTWRVGWSGEGASPVLFSMLLITEIYGLWALGTLAWYSWSRPPAVRPPVTHGVSIDVYVCTYDEPFEALLVRLGGAAAARGAARDRRRRHRDDRRGLPHDDPPAAPRIAFPPAATSAAG